MKTEIIDNPRPAYKIRAFSNLVPGDCFVWGSHSYTNPQDAKKNYCVAMKLDNQTWFNFDTGAVNPVSTSINDQVFGLKLESAKFVPVFA